MPTLSSSNHIFQYRIQQLAFKASQNMSYSQSKQVISQNTSRIHNYPHFTQNSYKNEKESHILQKSQKVSINRPKYEPRILSSIGKQVKTINQISSGILKKDSLNSYSKSSSQQHSYKQLMNATKKNRLSIDRSIYLDEKDIENIRSSVQNINKNSSLDIYQYQLKDNVSISRQLTPIKQERFSSDQYSQINNSKIQYGSPNIDRFTFQSTNTDPQTYTKNS